MAKKEIGWLLLLFTVFAHQRLYAQCSALSSAVTIDFQTDQACAPVTVNRFKITYYFLVPQNPADIKIRYEWNDPANTVNVVNATAGAGNKEFTADATFTYNDNNGQCVIIPTAYVVINGVVCQTSQQIQSAFFWGTDEQANGNVSIDPDNYEVCFDNPVVNAVLVDNTEFNCNMTVEPDHPNRLERNVQFVYGTNHNPAATIRNLTLTDGGSRALTDASGNLVNSQTRGTAGMPVTAGYFGPIDAIPFPADGPVSVSFPMNAPANVLNAVGNRFEVTLFNWNVCNPWNGSTANPNYEDAEMTKAYIVIVEAPAPDFETRDNLGNPASDFCVNETIFFANLTPNQGAYTYHWTFYDDATGSVQAGTSTGTNPSFAYTSGGTKLIRLQAENQSAQGACMEEITRTINITPALNAGIGITDLSDVPITPDFCQNAGAPPDIFEVRFHDISTGIVTPTTAWRWEFYDENNVIMREEPGGGGFSTSSIGPFDQAYTKPGIYLVRLIIRDNVTGCETTDEVQIHVYENPVAAFAAMRVCEGLPVSFADQSTLNSINGESIVLREWDFNYDGTFDKDPAYDNQTSFTRSLGTAGTYNVALRVTADQHACTDMVIAPVHVDPVPAASFTPDILSGCSKLTVNFTNNSVNGQPDAIQEYHWEIDEGSGFGVDSVQHPSDADFSNTYTKVFINNSSANKDYKIRLRVVTINNCEQVSAPQTITVYPGTPSGFSSLDYSPFNENCSPLPVSFSADDETQALHPVDYQWTVEDESGIIDQTSTGTDPSFDFNFQNDTQTLKDFSVSLRATLSTGCFGDSTRVIRVSPVPSSAFSIDTIDYNCEKMILNMNAMQKGLDRYEWTIISNGATLLNSASAGDAFDYEITRSTGVDQNVEIKLETENFANCKSPATSHFIDVQKTDVINASFTASPLSQQLPDATVVIDNNTNPGAWHYRWDFGDGNTSTDPAVDHHTYENFGTYTITLTVTSDNCIETRTATAEITPGIPVPEFDYDPAFGCASLTVNFINHSKYADPATFFWEFGADEGISDAINPSYTYYAPGTYSVSLTATGFGGEVVQVTKPLIIEVFDRPSAQFNVKPRQIPFPGGKIRTDNQSFGATGFLWDFGDGATSTEFEPEHLYNAEGVFDITLVASNAEGCADTTRLVAGVQTIRSGEVLVPNAFSPNTAGPGNSGGQNDVFRPILRGVTEFQMLVFNRWGELLFETKDPEAGWDGYYHGKLCQQDVYVYKIIATYSDGQSVTRVGDIHLIR